MPQLNLENSIAYFRNQLVPFNEATLSIASSPMLYGLSFYTVFGVSKTSEGMMAFRLADHYQRLINSAKIMDFHQFEEKWSFKRFETVMKQLISENNINENVLVRATVYIDEISTGTKIHGLTNEFCAYVYPLGEILPRTGVNLCVSSWIRTPDNSIPSRAKINGSYVNASLMKNEAILNGYDDAIALDRDGHVTEGTVANIFLVINGHLVTPVSSHDILEGITRDTITKIASELSLEVVQRTVDRSELYIVNEAFLCGSSALVTPILSIDKRKIADGAVGPITKKVAISLKAAQTGELSNFQHWVTKF